MFSEKYTIAETMLLELESSFSQKIEVNYELNRKQVSFQSNKSEPIFRWFHYREGFSKDLIEYIISKLGLDSSEFLDPFSGTATAPFTVQKNLKSKCYAIELMPVGSFFIECRNLFSTIGYPHIINFIKKIKKSRDEWLSIKNEDSFNHLRITLGAFSDETECELMKFMKWAELSGDESLYVFCKFTVLCILESISFTRKDGQYLRWDSRSPRFKDKKPSSFNKGEVLSFFKALISKIEGMESDINELKPECTGEINKKIELIEGSCLKVIDNIPDNKIGNIITSPPYCNRYDYTRTYALELAFLGTNELEIRKLRQELLSCTVENKPKEFSNFVDDKTLSFVNEVFSKQKELIGVLEFLEEECKLGKLNNKGIITMVRGYFYDMTLHLIQAFKKLKPSGRYIMVNDNVRYNGLNIPIDILLSNIAKDIGYNIEKIWVLPKGKGNSSQQMKTYGRMELRKCVYIWKKP